MEYDDFAFESFNNEKSEIKNNVKENNEIDNNNNSEIMNNESDENNNINNDDINKNNETKIKNQNISFDKKENIEITEANKENIENIEINKADEENKEIVENEQNALIEEMKKLEEDKILWAKKRKEQSELLDKYMDLLKSLQIKNKIELKDQIIEDTNFQIDELIKYNTKMNELESQERILEEEKMYFEKYMDNFNRAYEDKQKEIEELKINHEKEKEEINKRLEILEMEEKIINDKINNYEIEKKLMTERYNNAKNKEASLAQYKMRIENSMNELDRRNNIFEKNNEIINEAKNELNYQILKNANEEKKIIDEKNNLKLRQDMIDTLRMKYVDDITNGPFDLMSKTYNENNYKNDIHNIKNNKYNNEMNYSNINQNNFQKTNFKDYNYDIERIKINNNDIYENKRFMNINNTYINKNNPEEFMNSKYNNNNRNDSMLSLNDEK